MRNITLQFADSKSKTGKNKTVCDGQLVTASKSNARYLIFQNLVGHSYISFTDDGHCFGLQYVSGNADSNLDNNDMEVFRGIAKVLQVDNDKIVINIGNDKTMELKPRQLSKSIKVGDFVRHCEHGFYDIVDEKGNYI